jgi:RHS repeat-associated protein
VHANIVTSTRSDASGTHALTYGYDGSWLASEAWSGAGSTTGTVERVPDTDLRVDKLRVNGAQLTDYGYDRDGLLTSAVVGTGAGAGLSAMTLTRRADNGILTGTALGSVTTAETVTAFGEIDLASASYAGAVLFEEDVLTRDQLGRIVEKTESVAASGGGLDTASYAYDYDPAGRLTDVTIGGLPAAHYDYDPNGNRIAHVGASGTGATVVGRYDPQDRLLQYCPEDTGGVPMPTPGLPCFSYDYRDSGSLLTKTDLATSAVTMYDYDEFGNLLSVALPDGATVVSYEVDARNRRVGRSITTGGTTTVTHRWLYQDQLEPVAELDASNAVVATYVYATKAHVPDFMVKGAVTYRVVSDHLGSVRLVVNVADGTVAQRMDYDAWGNVLVDTAPGFQPFGYAGGLYDRDTGLVRFGARDYDAVTGRWTAKDDLLFDAGQDNLYVYVNSDPINSIDPTGNLTSGEIKAFCKESSDPAKCEAALKAMPIR